MKYVVVNVNALPVLLASEGKGMLSAPHCDIYQAMKTCIWSYDPLLSKPFAIQQEMWCNQNAKPLSYKVLDFSSSSFVKYITLYSYL
jgi:hypothetical protein